MKATKFDQRFFESTRGQIVSLLHGSNKTVNELADALGLSDNAVRAHLLTLERDNLDHADHQHKLMSATADHIVYNGR